MNKIFSVAQKYFLFNLIMCSKILCILHLTFIWIFIIVHLPDLNLIVISIFSFLISHLSTECEKIYYKINKSSSLWQSNFELHKKLIFKKCVKCQSVQSFLSTFFFLVIFLGFSFLSHSLNMTTFHINYTSHLPLST